MFLFDWFYDALMSLGLYHKNARILFLGLDNAGKTTLLHMLKNDRLKAHEPTIYPNTAELVMGKIKFKTFDLGGHEAARQLWQDYAANVDGIVYIVDAMDRARFPEAKTELDKLLSSEALCDVPVLVLGNKIDLPAAASEGELRNEMGIWNHCGTNEKQCCNDDASGSRPLELYMCSVVRKMGFADGFKWLSQFI